ncbi:transposase [Caminibacter sp.]
MTISIQGRSARVKDGYVYIGLSKTFKEKYEPKIEKLVFKLPKHIQVDKLQEIRIIPVFNGMEFDIEFVYKKQVEPLSMDKDRYLSIDMGLDNLSTCYSDSGAAFIIDGRYLKSINRYYNKRVAYLKSIYDRQCERLGINYILQDESYTSKASFIDMDIPANNVSFSGKRIKRGLYRTKDGLKINADINGAANILVKYLKINGLDRELENFYSTRYGCVSHPMRLRLVAPSGQSQD